MKSDSNRSNDAIEAFGRHIPTGYHPMHCQAQEKQDDNDIFDVLVAYPDGFRQATVMLSTKGTGYSVCITRVSVGDSSTYPHTWHHGFLEKDLGDSKDDDHDDGGGAARFPDVGSHWARPGER